jgi:hypothetical protein
MRTGAPECRSHAVGALTNLSSFSDQAREEMFDNGAVPLLLEALAAGSAEVKERAAYALWNLSSLSHIRSHLFAIGAAKRVVLQLTCPERLHSMSPPRSPDRLKTSPPWDGVVPVIPATPGPRKMHKRSVSISP